MEIIEVQVIIILKTKFSFVLEYFFISLKMGPKRKDQEDNSEVKKSVKSNNKRKDQEDNGGVEKRMILKNKVLYFYCTI